MLEAILLYLMFYCVICLTGVVFATGLYFLATCCPNSKTFPLEPK